MAVLNIRVDDRVRDQLKEMADDQGVTTQRVRPRPADGGGRARLRARGGARRRAPGREHADHRPAGALAAAPDPRPSAAGGRQRRRRRPGVPADAREDPRGGLHGRVLVRDRRLQHRAVEARLRSRVGHPADVPHHHLQHRPPREGGDARRREAGPPARVPGLRPQRRARGAHGELRRVPDARRRPLDRAEAPARAQRRGNSHSPVLDTYLRMLSEYRRIMDSRERGVRRIDYLLSLEELEQIADARVHPPTGPRRADRAEGRFGSEGRSLLRRSVACCLVRSERHGLVAHALQDLEVAQHDLGVMGVGRFSRDIRSSTSSSVRWSSHAAICSALGEPSIWPSMSTMSIRTDAAPRRCLCRSAADVLDPAEIARHSSSCPTAIS